MAKLKFFLGGQWAKLERADVSGTDTTPGEPGGGNPSHSASPGPRAVAVARSLDHAGDRRGSVGG
jgi:hypothetical protein